RHRAMESRLLAREGRSLEELRAQYEAGVAHRADGRRCWLSLQVQASARSSQSTECTGIDATPLDFGHDLDNRRTSLFEFRKFPEARIAAQRSPLRINAQQGR